MRKTIIFVSLTILLISSSIGWTQKFDTLWTRTYWNGYFDSTNCVGETSDHGFIITGVTRAEGQIDTDLHLIKTDSSGYGDWNKVIGGDANECGFHVFETNDGGFLVSGQKDAPAAALGKVWVLKTHADGETDWEYMLAPDDDDINGYPTYAIQTRDNGYAITGVINISHDNKAFLLRLDSDGGFVDFDTVSEYSYQDGVFLAQLPDNGYIVAGSYNNLYETGYDFWAFRTNASGTVIWDSIYAITDYTDIAYGGCIDANGVVMVGVARGESWAHKIDFNGNTIWSESISYYSTGERSTNICTTPDGGYMVGGWIWVTGHRRDFSFTRLNNMGNTLWQYTVGEFDDDHGQWIKPTSDGGYVMAGPSSSFVNGECHYLVKARSYFCGDANGDDLVDVGDVAYLINFIFRDGAEPVLGYCHGDVNDDGLTNVGDAVHLINYIFRGGDPPIENCCE